MPLLKKLIIMSGSGESSRKVIFVGDCSVGKTCLINMLCGSEFDPSPKSTVSAHGRHATFISTDGRSVSLDLWDTAGQEKYRSISKFFFRDASLAILCHAPILGKESFNFATVKPQWLQAVASWLETLSQFAHHDCPIILVTTKSDLLPTEAVDEWRDCANGIEEEIRNAGLSLPPDMANFRFDGRYETSAMTKQGERDLVDAMIAAVGTKRTPGPATNILIETRNPAPADCC
jgi:small GTP-binding protein